jgi:hypothetical protein
MSNADAGGTCPGSTCTLRQAIATAITGDTIDFAGGVGTINLTSGELLVDKNLTINGPGANALTVQRSAAAGTANFRVLEIAAGSASVSIAKLTIAAGSPGGAFPASAGGGIQHNSTGTLSLTGCSIVGNQGSLGGGVYVENGTLAVNGCTFQGNIASAFDGGGIYNDGSATMNISNSTFTGNSSNGNAGAIFNNTGVLTVTNCTIAGNTCASFGGGIANYKTLNLKGSLVAGNAATFDNSAPDIGGAVTSQGYNRSDR